MCESRFTSSLDKMGDDLTFDQLWVAGDDETQVYGAAEIGDFDEDAVILENPNEEMNKPVKRKLGASQEKTEPIRSKHEPKNRPVPLTEEQVAKKRSKIEKMKAKKRQKEGGARKSSMLRVLTESPDRQADYFWSEYCACLGGDLTLAEIGQTLPASSVCSLGE